MKTIIFIVAVLPFFLIGCAHKKVGPSASVQTAPVVSPTLEGEDQDSDQSATRGGVRQTAWPSEEPGGPVEKPDNEPAGDWDDDFDDFDDQEEIVEVSDPLFYFNRAMFHVNDRLYFWALKPVGTVYKTVFPEFFRIGIRNFFHNISFPIRFAANVLQGKGGRAQAELGRFMFNSTFGVLGFGNPAKQFDHLNPPKEDLGQAFGHWGVGEGFYLVLPVFGPSTLRDSIGLVGEHFLSPVTYLEDWQARLTVNGTRVVNQTSLRIGDYEAFKDAAIDPYASMRDGYIQDRRADIIK